MTTSGVFGRHFNDYSDIGLPVFPVDTGQKRPAIKGWQQASAARARRWAASPRLAAVDGIGLLMGSPSRIVEIDVDAVGNACLAAALERFGATPVSIRTASGKSKLWYRHAGEERRIRAIPDLPVDVLGSGFTIAPPSFREDLGTAYCFLSGDLSDLDRLPTIRANSLDVPRRFAAAEGVSEGERNTSLWFWCMTEARHCDDVEALIDAAQTWSNAMPVPLGAKEVERVARSAWRYESEGRNFVGLRCPQISRRDQSMDDLRDEPYAFWLLELFRRYHASRESFAISPEAMSSKRHPPWNRRTIERARDVLIERGYVVVVIPPCRRKRKAGRYRLATAGSADNH